MTRPNRPSIQQTVAGVNDRIGVPGGGGGIQAVSPVLQVSVDASDVMREVRWAHFVHTMVGLQNIHITLPVVPQTEAHKYLFIGIGGQSPETYVVRVLYPAQGVLPAVSSQKVTLQKGTDANLLAYKTDSDDAYGKLYQELIIYPGGQLVVESESNISLGSNVTLDLLWEILPSPARSMAQAITPVVTET